jgi:hypothetical protein
MGGKNMLEQFKNYVWSFYGPGQIYGDFFNHTLTRLELDAAVDKRLQEQTFAFDGDSMDRERVRDLMTKARSDVLVVLPVPSV